MARHNDDWKKNHLSDEEAREIRMKYLGESPDALTEKEEKALKKNLGLNSQRLGYQEYLDELLEKLVDVEEELKNPPVNNSTHDSVRSELERRKSFYDREIEKILEKIEKIESAKGYSELEEKEVEEELNKIRLDDRGGIRNKRSLGSIGFCSKNFYDAADEYYQTLDDAANP